VLEASHNDLRKVVDLRRTEQLPGISLCLLDNRGLVQCSDSTMAPPISPFGGHTIRGIYSSLQTLVGVTEEGEFLSYQCYDTSDSEGQSVECREPELVNEGFATLDWTKVFESDDGTSLGLLYSDGKVSRSPPYDDQLDLEGRYAQAVLHAQPSDRYYSICGVTLEGSLKCEGQEGFAPSDDILPLPEGEFVQLGTDHGLACALTPELEMVCWGDLLEEIPIEPCTRDYVPIYGTGD
jgi:hypothetical protein